MAVLSWLHGFGFGSSVTKLHSPLQRGENSDVENGCETAICRQSEQRHAIVRAKPLHMSNSGKTLISEAAFAFSSKPVRKAFTKTNVIRMPFCCVVSDRTFSHNFSVTFQKSWGQIEFEGSASANNETVVRRFGIFFKHACSLSEANNHKCRHHGKRFRRVFAHVLSTATTGESSKHLSLYLDQVKQSFDVLMSKPR